MKKADKPKNIRDLYPKLTEKQLEEAEENLEQYLEVVLRIYERIASDPAAYAELQKLLAEEERNKKSKKHD